MNAPLKNSHARALEWERNNFDRSMHLNDMLDLCSDMCEKRELYKTFTDDEKNGMMVERQRRLNDREAPIGSLVRPARMDDSMDVFDGSHKWTYSAQYKGLATVIGSPEHGSLKRFVFLHEPCKLPNKQSIVFGVVLCDDLEVVK